ncbi:hypothetical protein IGI37_001001 [Enterococcus sp. AZ194]|uniref:thioredoxin family protein n=1 Tax=Enterococcus sp. AZ194 TaxID=2774629 RepID=UPI003F29AB9A
MKKKFIIIVCLLFISLTTIIIFKNISNTEKEYFKDITYEQLKEMETEDYVLFVRKDGCMPCKSITPYVNKLSKMANYNVVSVRLNNLNNSDTFQNELHINGTPTVIRFKNGVEKNRVFGMVNEETFFGDLGVKDYEKK